jgi:hypothetical protein
VVSRKKNSLSLAENGTIVRPLVKANGREKWTGPGPDYRLCAHAAGGGNLEVLKWARAQGSAWDAMTCAYAAGAGHLDVGPAGIARHVI